MIDTLHAPFRGKKQKPLSPFIQPEQPREQKISFGSGMVIHSKGYILTCHHVVNDMETIRVKSGQREDVFQGRLVWVYPKKDIDVIKMNTLGSLPVVKFTSTRHVSIRDRVFTIPTQEFLP